MSYSRNFLLSEMKQNNKPINRQRKNKTKKWITSKTAINDDNNNNKYLL